MPKCPYHLIILAAGQGSRLKNSTPKAYTPICGVPLLRHTLNSALTWPEASSIHVVIDPLHKKLYDRSTEGLALPEPIEGGSERSESVCNALNALSHINDKDIVLIHDAARPFVSSDDVRKLLNSLETYEAATLAAPVTDTVRNGHNEIAGDILDRTNLRTIQTPQAFHYGTLKKAHDLRDKNTPATDDTSLVSSLGIDVKLVEGSRENFKITLPEDLKMANALLSSPTETRTGTGYDVHAFTAESKNRPLMLCGVHIPYNKSLAGHSDADVGLHALTDALLGALGKGDIGDHFPPTDSHYKNMDSAVFVEKVVKDLQNRNGWINNLDITLICESPKIGPYKEKMKNRVAELCLINPERVNVKATTTEKLGFEGREEGIAAQAVATITLQN